MSTPTESQPRKGGYFDTQKTVSLFYSSLDRLASPEARQNAYDNTLKFGHQRPVLSSYIILQLLFALIPLLLFIGFTICTVLFSVSVALCFSFFWAGVAVVVLFWTILLTFTFASVSWLFLAGCFYFVKWVESMVWKEQKVERQDPVPTYDEKHDVKEEKDT
ncbi:hypothetical protein TWF694_006375 [Orbilia ellipsospora]|uniref:Uncharacterized protein n=1 Tax=Orbilia ellipsospora TaxID=2528407 RepID=A0AAV9XJW6_9PEZI